MTHAQSVMKWRSKNSEKYNAYMREWTRKNVVKKMVWGARKRARQDGLPFDISPEDLTVPEICPVLGIPILCGDLVRGAGSPSIDKIDNSKGYIKGNVRIISWRANRLKSDATPEELRLLAVDAFASPKVKVIR